MNTKNDSLIYPFEGVPKIIRVWRGRTSREKADEYAKSLCMDALACLSTKALDVQMFRQDTGGESEFVIISYWESREAISKFACPDSGRIHDLECDETFLTGLSSIEVLNIVNTDRNYEQVFEVQSLRFEV
jgi:hypothetical protein